MAERANAEAQAVLAKFPGYLEFKAHYQAKSAIKLVDMY
jgi:hypothetical protein